MIRLVGITTLAAKCPECGSKNTIVNWLKPKNYRKAALTVVDPILGMLAGRYDRICLEHFHKSCSVLGMKKEAPTVGGRDRVKGSSGCCQ